MISRDKTQASSRARHKVTASSVLVSPISPTCIAWCPGRLQMPSNPVGDVLSWSNVSVFGDTALRVLLIDGIDEPARTGHRREEVTRGAMQRPVVNQFRAAAPHCRDVEQRLKLERRRAGPEVLAVALVCADRPSGAASRSRGRRVLAADQHVPPHSTARPRAAAD